MLPDISNTYTPEVLEDLEPVRQPSLGWKIDFNTKKVTGRIDGSEAVEQAIYLILSTERYEYPIYSWSHGFETYDLYGKNPHLIIPQLQKRIYDALYQDDRITGISNFKLENVKGVYHASFNVTTIYGDTLSIETEVSI